ncbi:MAG: capsular exopolysaccharide synthesis family protein [Candidatus Aldehydirespiratoraceae bacterium]|jgi:capsular exopolysaccharide synthesis family protein
MALVLGYPQSGSVGGCGTRPLWRNGDVRELEGELDLEDYLALFRRRWRWVAGSVLIIAGFVAVFTLTRDELYQSRTEVQILTEENSGGFNVTEERLFRDAIAELQYMNGRRYQDAVSEAAGYDVESESSLRFVDSSEKSDGVGILRILVNEASPARAAQGAEAAAAVYLDSRLREITRNVTNEGDNNQAAKDLLVGERTELNTAISEAEADVLNASTDAARQSAILAAELVRIELNPRVQSLTSQIGRLNNEIAQGQSILATLSEEGSTARLLQPANTPSQPVSPNVPRNLMLGMILGFVVGLILAFLRDLLDTRARDGAELAQLVDIPVMATIGEIRSQRSAPGRIRRYADLNVEESSGYQVLLNSLWLSNSDEPLQSIVFTSDRPGVGKTQTVVNLAQAEAARGTRVLIIDTDFVNPSVAGRLGLPASKLGLADLLEGAAPAELVVTDSEVENLHIIDAQGRTGASELLRSDRLGGVLAELYATYDLILIDSPPTLSTSDSRLVASQADAAVVVYDPAQSRREELQRTIDLLRSARVNLIGLVANRSRSSHPVYLSSRER